MATIRITKTFVLPESSIIDEIHYDVETCSLQILFKPQGSATIGRTYLYSEVPEEVVKAMCRAKSVGSYFSQHIRNLYETVEVFD